MSKLAIHLKWPYYQLLDGAVNAKLSHPEYPSFQCVNFIVFRLAGVSTVTFTCIFIDCALFNLSFDVVVYMHLYYLPIYRYSV